MTNIDIRQLRIIQYEDFVAGVQDGRTGRYFTASLPVGDVATDDLLEAIQYIAIRSQYDGYQVDDKRRVFNMGMSASSQEVILTIFSGIANGAAAAFAAEVIAYVKARQSEVHDTETRSDDSTIAPPMNLIPDLQESTALVSETLAEQFGVNEDSISIVSSEVGLNGARVVARDDTTGQHYEANISGGGILMEIRER